ncbi:LacI family transcriptional regulator [Streptomyces sp. WAC 00631]|uniref:LacI family DNA-binding transcriptional regulator n=1 Tax=unclassified Streptomyces TaxID=2593676 RepID=UPI001E3D5792|nr:MULTISPECIES: LacI family DNA-binding transcriptional regulator [unclassified Streptomyces]MCC5033078.1 LacI family transcriptional regulator [Streptomyces sp. WAC 00631]MCC9741160.1 LacI family transcriptional regulator [Streptomyces sp. MNU89]
MAREAGVAASTVSRALSTPGRVSATTREHILETAERLGYRTNPLARALPSGRTDTVALCVSDITNPHFFGIIRGAEQQTRAAGCTLIVGDAEESPDLEVRHVQRLGPSVDGFVIAASRMPDDRIRDLAANHRLTLVNRQVDGVNSTIIDHEDGTRQIVEHLSSLGHTSVVYLAGPRQSWLAAQRWRVVEAAARELAMSAARLGPFPPAVLGGAAAADAALASGATAAIAHNDLLAIGMLRRLAERRVRVPEDISVVGYDDIFGADFCSPPLTTLGGSFTEAGRLAVDLLLGMRDAAWRSETASQVVLPSHLIVRESTGPAPRHPR